MAIRHPEKPSRKDLAFTAAMTAGEHLPWIGVAISLLGLIVPRHFTEDEERWRREVTDELNELARLCHRPTVSRDRLAWLMALLAAKLDVEGTGEVFIPHEEWEERFSNYSKSQIGEALAELSHAEWIQCSSDANSMHGIGGFYATSLLFAHTHPWVHQIYPSDDAKEVAEFALENADPDADAVSAMDIKRHFQWERKRFYPALAYLADEILPEESLERHYHPEYPFIWLRLNGEVRRLLRRFIGRD